MRYTYKALQEDAKRYSAYLIESGAPFYFVAGHRNGYSAIDLFIIDDNGNKNCWRMVAGGSPRECLHAMETEYKNLHGKPSHCYKYTRKMAKGALSLIMDFNADFFAQSLAHSDALHTWAKLTKYRKPKFANGSTGRYFFYHLANKVKL